MIERNRLNLNSVTTTDIKKLIEDISVQETRRHSNVKCDEVLSQILHSNGLFISWTQHALSKHPLKNNAFQKMSWQFFFSFFFDKLYEKKKPLKCGTCYNNFSGKQTLKRHLLKGFSRELFKRSAIFFAIISEMKNLDQWLTKRYLLSRKLLISCQGFKVVIKIRSELQHLGHSTSA